MLLPKVDVVLFEPNADEPVLLDELPKPPKPPDVLELVPKPPVDEPKPPVEPPPNVDVLLVPNALVVVELLPKPPVLFVPKAEVPPVEPKPPNPELILFEPKALLELPKAFVCDPPPKVLFVEVDPNPILEPPKPPVDGCDVPKAPDDVPVPKPEECANC